MGRREEYLRKVAFALKGCAMDANGDTDQDTMRGAATLLERRSYNLSRRQRKKGRSRIELGSKRDRLSGIIGRPVYLLIPVIRHFWSISKMLEQNVC
jgi:hypothetical protein